RRSSSATIGQADRNSVPRQLRRIRWADREYCRGDPVLPNFLQNLFNDDGGIRNRPGSGTILLWLLRGCFGLVVIGMATYIGLHLVNRDRSTDAAIAFSSILLVGLLVVVSDVLVRNKQITTLSAVYFGLLLGL